MTNLKVEPFLNYTVINNIINIYKNEILSFKHITTNKNNSQLWNSQFVEKTNNITSPKPMDIDPPGQLN